MVAMLLSSGAYAQVSPAPQSSPDASADEAITVTGTRIRRPDLASNSPITSVTDQEIKYQGAVNVESVLNRLPQFTADANENVSNGSDGTANINLRNLGSNRTLILLNGQRLLPQQAIDLNFVPSALIDRVDVVTGGASAVYGSDAVAGVVNFVLKDHLDGLRIDVQSGLGLHTNDNSAVRNILTTRGYANAPGRVADGGKQDLNAAYGKNFANGRGNITVYGGYRHTDPVLQANRDVSACALNPSDSAGNGLICGGSSNTPIGTFVPLGGLNSGTTLTNNANGTQTWVPYTSAYAYNYAPTNYFQRSDERYTGGAFAKFEIAPIAEIYGSFMYMKDHTFSQVAPSALFLGTTFTVPCNNPLMSAAQQQSLCGATAGTAATQDTLIGYRLGSGQSRRDDLRHQDYRYSAGVRGDLGHGFHYDLNYLHSLVRYNETYLNNVDNVKAQRALDVVTVNGVPTCRSVIDGSDPACVPVNVFQANAITDTQGAYLFSESNTASRNVLDVFSANLTGDLGTFGISSPWATRGVNIAVGAERRRETLNFTADAIAQQGGTTNSDGRITVNEGYGEIEVPILQDLPFAHELTINGGLRYSAYRNDQQSTGLKSKYNVWTYKGEATWAPSKDARFRFSYNRAIRAPNISELFGSRSIGNVSAQDPCSGTAPTTSVDICRLTGVTQAQYGNIVECPSDTCSAQYGGNSALKPEKADTYTAGLVLTPRMVRNLTLTVDYYRIKVKDYISSVDPSLAISQCVAASDPFYCGLFTRDPRSGALFGSNGYIVSTTYNTGSLKTSGIDLTADYTLGIGALGKLNLNMVGTRLISQESEPLKGLGSYDCKGLYGYTCGQPNPKWRHVVRTTWSMPQGASVSVSWRHIDQVKLSSLSDNSFLAGTPSVINRKISAYNYIDLAGTVAVGEGLQLRAGVNNLFDKNPPVIASGILSSFGNGNTYPGVYDVLGRTLFVGATVNF
ncbi:TonB-dependent receptor-like protein [Sphingomonas sp. PP-CE-3A-406]|uniref:TonB-dependent receptor n=1 Tax=Sphingomonas sp. PP-CE-3A-406 TaxID=2135659 RepID=UPI000EF9833E|nr:TonB-dependent receptor [Sphingomonas sp. PP-CE-3A-406]RMB54601.1 TonB-dependent receptor-like protein [Sphingomonas sp. PP-CE-3A-406]